MKINVESNLVWQTIGMDIGIGIHDIAQCLQSFGRMPFIALGESFKCQEI